MLLVQGSDKNDVWLRLLAGYVFQAISFVDAMQCWL
jgi:hypothetical protein